LKGWRETPGLQLPFENLEGKIKQKGVQARGRLNNSTGWLLAYKATEGVSPLPPKICYLKRRLKLSQFIKVFTRKNSKKEDKGNPPFLFMPAAYF